MVIDMMITYAGWGKIQKRLSIWLQYDLRGLRKHANHTRQQMWQQFWAAMPWDWGEQSEHSNPAINKNLIWLFVY